MNEKTHLPEDSRFLDNPIGVCELRDNLIVNQQFCDICKIIYFPCPWCGGKLKSVYPNNCYDTKSECTKCGRQLTTRSEEYQRYLKKKRREEKEFLDIIKEDILIVHEETF